MSEEILQEKDKPAFYDSTCFWNQLRIHHKTVWSALDIGGAFLGVVAAAFILPMIPAKDISGMVQDLLPPMMGILATLIAFVFAGLVFFVSFHADDEYILYIGRDDPDTYSSFLFLFWWNATTGIIALIVGLFVYMASYSSGLSGEITVVFLFLFFYTIISVWTLFGTLARHGMYELRTYIEWEKEEEGAKPESVRTASPKRIKTSQHTHFQTPYTQGQQQNNFIYIDSSPAPLNHRSDCECGAGTFRCSCSKHRTRK